MTMVTMNAVMDGGGGIDDFRGERVHRLYKGIEDLIDGWNPS